MAALRGITSASLRRHGLTTTRRPFHPLMPLPARLALPPSRRLMSEQKYYFKEYQESPTPPSGGSSFRRLLRRTLFYSFLTFGTAFATLYYLESNWPLSYPETGSEEDEEIVQLIEELAEDLDIVKEMRTQVHPDGTKVWKDLNSLIEGRIRRGLAQTLKGSGRIALRKYFWDEKGKRLCCVIHISIALSGWPHTTHGGLLATLLDEALGITAISAFPVKTGVTANLKVQYLKPTKTDQFIVIKTELTDMANDRKALVRGQVLDLDGTVLVTSVGLFVVPKKLELQKLQSFKEDEGTK